MALTHKKRVTILGSTGSVGTQTIDLVARNLDDYQVVALTARRNVKLLVEQAKKLKPEYVAIADEAEYQNLKDALHGTGIEVGGGAAAVVEAAEHSSDWVMAAIVGSAGLPSTLAAVRRGAQVAFANKETLVCAGALMMKLVEQSGAKLLPVDSEHNAIWQVFDFDRRDAVERLILTCSGGPFRNAKRDVMQRATVAEAVKHPTWSMGAKISVDSATLMNKGLEMIEAHYLFDIPPDKIEAIIHPQSVIHSMVEYRDGSVLAQLGTPDMRIPIAYCLAWPDRMETPAKKLRLEDGASLTFEKPDGARFPALGHAHEAMKRGGTAPAILNAANEVAVAAFLEGQIGFLDIEKVNESVLSAHTEVPMTSLEVLDNADRESRRLATQVIAKLKL